MLKSIIISSCLLTLQFEVLTQELPVQQSAETLMELTEEDDMLPEDQAVLMEELNEFRENRLNLNQAERKDLEKLLFLTDFQIQSLLTYRSDHGPILSLYELQLIYGFDSITVAWLLPFVEAGEQAPDQKFKPKDMIHHGKHEVVFREQRVIQPAAGYATSGYGDKVPDDASRYYGSRDKMLLRYRFHCQQRIFWGFTMEKDAGEEFFNGSNRFGFDFYSGYIQMNNKGILQSVLIGDYRVTVGQGLALWSGAAFGKSPFPNTLQKRQEFLKKNTSTDENAFFRGAAINVGLRKLNLLVFYSTKRMDANIIDTFDSGMKVFTAFQETGYHRNGNEIKDENTLRENAAGAYLFYRNRFLKTGLVCAGYCYDGYLQKKESLYQKYAWQGNRALNVGWNYSFSLKKVQMFGETAWGNSALATLNGIILTPHPRVTVSLLHRYYEPGYFARYAGALSEHDPPSNESALYLGTAFQPFRYWKITAFADFYRFPWLTPSLPQPSSGMESWLQADFNPEKTVSFYLRFRTNEKYQSYTPPGTVIKATQRSFQSSLRLHASFHISERLQLRNRVEWKSIDFQATNDASGFLLYQDIIYHFTSFPLQVHLRYLLFRTDNYASRIYAYEDDLLYSFYIPAFYDEGYRSYLLIRWNVSKKLSFWLKFGNTGQEGVASTGTGADEMEGNNRSEIRIQMRWVI
jgi:hypothetical protein